jgi:hypothetical protein
MKYKTSRLLLFNKHTILNCIPNIRAVFYLRGIADEKALYPIYYIGMTKKEQLRQNLLRLFFEINWADIIYINYIQFDSKSEAKQFAQEEISKYQPKYNYNHDLITVYEKNTTNKTLNFTK